MKTTTLLILTLFLLTSMPGRAQPTTDTLTAFPNPFYTVTTLHFEIMNKDTVTLMVLDRWGSILRTFFTDSVLSSGTYAFDFQGDTLANGKYIVALQLGANKKLGKIIFKERFPTVIKESSRNNKIVFFPNPATEFLTIGMEGMKNIIITNMNGQIYKTIETSSQTVSLDNLPTGILIVSVFDTKNKLLMTQKIINGK